MLDQDPENHPSTVATKKSFFSKGLLVSGLLFSVFIALSFRHSVSAVYCDEKAITPNPDIVMLSTTWCPYCKEARRYFSNNDLAYCEYDIERSGTGKRLYESINGQGIPVILIGKHKLNGFNERSVKKALEILHTS